MCESCQLKVPYEPLPFSVSISYFKNCISGQG